MAKPRRTGARRARREWPVGGGEMGACIRAFDWAPTALGSRETWPTRLRYLVEILLASPNAMSVLWGPDAILLYNDPFAATLNLTAQFALGRPALQTFAGARPAFADHLQTAWSGASVQLTDHPYPVLRGGGMDVGWFDITYTPIHQEHGQVEGVLCILSETTARVLAERDQEAHRARQAFLLALSDALRPLADPVAIQTAASRVLGEHLGVDRAYYVEVNEAEQYARVNRDYLRGGSPSLIGTFPLPDFGWTVPHLRRGETIVVADADTSRIIPDADRPAIAAVQTRAHVSVPILKEGMLLGAVCVTEATPRAWTALEIDLVRETAERIWDAIERAEAEAALRVSAERYRSLFDTMAEGFAVCDVVRDDRVQVVDLTYRELNQALERQTGLDRQTMIGRRLTDVLPPQDIKAWLPIYARVADSGEPYEFEQYTELLKRWFAVSVYPWRRDQISLFYRDVHERKRLEETIRQSEASLRALTNLVPDLLWQADASGQNISYNRRWLEYTGQPAEETQGPIWMQSIHPDDRPTTQGAFALALATGQPLEMEYRLRRHDGVYRWFLVRQVPVHDETGRVERWFGAATDIHEQRAEREELADQVYVQTAQLRALSQRLIEVQEEERRHLARELHDEVGQELTGLQLHLRATRGAEAGERDKSLLEAEAQVNALTEQVRMLSRNLRPTTLDTFGLLAALAELVRRLGDDAGLHVDLRHEGLERRFPPEVEIVAYRIVQEALTNVVRHANVDAATIQLLAESDVISVSIRDAGRGFDAGATSRAGGLGGMHERAALLGGGLEVESSPGSGTRVIAELPYVQTPHVADTIHEPRSEMPEHG